MTPILPGTDSRLGLRKPPPARPLSDYEKAVTEAVRRLAASVGVAMKDIRPISLSNWR